MTARSRRPKTKEQYHGVTKLMNRCAELLFANPVTPTRPSQMDVVFKGRTRQDTKRALLKYWLQNRTSLEMELEEFQRQCVWTSDGEIVFQTRSMG